VEFGLGEIEILPVPDGIVDAIGKVIPSYDEEVIVDEADHYDDIERQQEADGELAHEYMPAHQVLQVEIERNRHHA